MSKKIKFSLLILAMLAGGSAMYMGWQWLGLKKNVYHAIYMRSGDIYFGVLTRSSKLMLSNAYALIRDNNERSPYQIIKITDMAWGPAGSLELNEKQVLWIAELAADGTVMKHIQSQKTE
jgi:hypothetical protein